MEGRKGWSSLLLGIFFLIVLVDLMVLNFCDWLCYIYGWSDFECIWWNKNMLLDW